MRNAATFETPNSLYIHCQRSSPEMSEGETAALPVLGLAVSPPPRRRKVPTPANLTHKKDKRAAERSHARGTRCPSQRSLSTKQGGRCLADDQAPKREQETSQTKRRKKGRVVLKRVNMGRILEMKCVYERDKDEGTKGCRRHRGWTGERRMITTRGRYEERSEKRDRTEAERK